MGVMYDVDEPTAAVELPLTDETLQVALGARGESDKCHGLVGVTVGIISHGGDGRDVVNAQVSFEGGPNVSCVNASAGDDQGL